MRSVVYLQTQKDQMEKKNGVAREKKDSQRRLKRWRDYFFFHNRNKFIEVFDTYILLVITYSCFASAYYCAFEFPTRPILMIFEHIVFASFVMDILFKCMRLPPQPT